MLHHPHSRLTADAGQRPHLPGEAGIWVFVLGDMTAFALFFMAFLSHQAEQPAIFAAGRQSLNVTVGAANMMVLLLSSWLMALGLDAVRMAQTPRAVRLFGAVIACGLVFSVLKILEYHEKARAGIAVQTDDFYTLYFALTGVHFLHVLIGIGFVAAICRHVRRHSTPDMRLVEGGAIYWHMVDLLWIVLFPLIYLAH